MHCLGPYKVKIITDKGVVQLRDLEGIDLKGIVNGSQLNLYKDNQPPIA
jgi:hypothetical protein